MPLYPQVTLATALGVFWRMALKPTAFPLSSNRFVKAYHIMIRYPTLPSTSSSLPLLCLVFLSPFSSSSLLSNLSSSKPRVSSLLLCLSSCSCSWALGLFPARVEAKNFRTAWVVDSLMDSFIRVYLATYSYGANCKKRQRKSFRTTCTSSSRYLDTSPFRSLLFNPPL